ncbi:MAG TPA: TauD/TfdA family dioxygenase [Herpetosiphonaceae bacterium]
MSQPPKKPDIKTLGVLKRQTVTVSEHHLIRTSHLWTGETLPLVIEPAVDGLDLRAWVASNRGFIESQLLKFGGILFRNFQIRTETEFEQLITAASGTPLAYNDRATPRSQITSHIFTSTDYPADQQIELHNESSYAHTWPLKIFFFSQIVAAEGGATPIADSRQIVARIDPAIRQRFIEKQVMYVRNFGQEFGLPWQTVFNTTDRATMEAFCRSADIAVEWKDEQRLRTRQIRPAVARHPSTGDMVWFNQATAFHVSTLAAATRDLLLGEYAPDELPKNVFYGDGTPIEDDVLDHIRAIYRQATVAFPWQPGDLLMLDNMLVAHGRAPFVGPRKVLVGMAEPCSWQAVA